ncbi:MAG: hypothetical protein ACK40A_09885, partial [Pannonibacter indicus]
EALVKVIEKENEELDKRRRDAKSRRTSAATPAAAKTAAKTAASSKKAATHGPFTSLIFPASA